jgi:hypothetical protein
MQCPASFFMTCDKTPVKLKQHNNAGLWHWRVFIHVWFFWDRHELRHYKKAFRVCMQEYLKGFAHFPIFFIPGSANTLSSESGI